MTRGCPHEDVRFCPLYVALHDARTVGFGCDDGRLDQGSCGTARRVDYGKQLARLRATETGRRIVAVCSFKAEAEAAAAQRRRNRHGNAIH